MTCPISSIKCPISIKLGLLPRVFIVGRGPSELILIDIAKTGPINKIRPLTPNKIRPLTPTPKRKE
jgi:hypothetical protein